jgi:phosphoglycerate kinase
MDIKSPLLELNCKEKRIFLRADLNIPLHGGKILSDFRLKAIQPTLDYILQKGGKIILATHIDRPKGYDPLLSTQVLLDWFKKNSYSVIFETDLKNAYTKSFGDPHTIVLLDNLRFYPGEKGCDPQFAQSLARLGDYYINDAFGMLASTDCSVWQVPQLFAPEKRMFGLLIEKELAHAQILSSAKKPFTMIIGGNKITEKIQFIHNLLPQLDYLLLCPAFVFSFLKAQGSSVGISRVDPETFTACLATMQEAQNYGVKIIMPVDYWVSNNSFGNSLTVKAAHDLNNHDYGISIGLQTQAIFKDIIMQSKTVLYNGLMGDLAYPESLNAIKDLFATMAQSSAYTVIGGGDSAAAAYLFGFENAIDYISTGGGALIAYLSNQELPALKILD